MRRLLSRRASPLRRTGRGKSALFPKRNPSSRRGAADTIFPARFNGRQRFRIRRTAAYDTCEFSLHFIVYHLFRISGGSPTSCRSNPQMFVFVLGSLVVCDAHRSESTAFENASANGSEHRLGAINADQAFKLPC